MNEEELDTLDKEEPNAHNAPSYKAAQREEKRKAEPNHCKEDDFLYMKWTDINDHDRKVMFEDYACLKIATPEKVAIACGTSLTALNGWVNYYYSSAKHLRNPNESALEYKIRTLKAKGEMLFHAYQNKMARNSPEMSKWVGKNNYGQKDNLDLSTNLDISNFFHAEVEPALTKSPKKIMKAMGA